MVATPHGGARLGQILPGAYLSLLIQSLTLNIVGPVLPLLAIENATTPETLGVAFTLSGAGFLVGTLLSNRVADRLGLRATIVAGLVLMGLGLLGVMATPLPWLFLAVFCQSLGNALVEVQLNRAVEYLAGERPGEVLNRLHSMWGVGGMIAALGTAALIVGGWPWRWIAGLALVGVLASIGLVLRWPWVAAPREVATGHGGPASAMRKAWGVMAPFAVTLFVYVGLEISTSSWATTFFAGLGEGVVAGALATAGYFLLFTLGRWFAGPVVDRLGLMRMVRLALALAAIGIALTAWPTTRLVGFALAGLGQSLVFPTVLVWGVRRHPIWRPELNAVALGAAGAASMTVPYLIGVAVAAAGTGALTPILVILTILALAVTATLH